MCAGVAVSGGARGLSGADIRESNIGAILRTLRAEGPLSRSGLAQRLALSKSGMTPIIAEMVERGLVREQAGTLQRRGRPPLLLSVTADDLCIVGVELRRDRVGYTVEAFDGSTLMSVHRAHESIPEDPGHAAALVASSRAQRVPRSPLGSACPDLPAEMDGWTLPCSSGEMYRSCI